MPQENQKLYISHGFDPNFPLLPLGVDRKIAIPENQRATWRLLHFCRCALARENCFVDRPPRSPGNPSRGDHSSGDHWNTCFWVFQWSSRSRSPPPRQATVSPWRPAAASHQAPQGQQGTAPWLWKSNLYEGFDDTNVPRPARKWQYQLSYILDGRKEVGLGVLYHYRKAWYLVPSRTYCTTTRWEGFGCRQKMGADKWRQAVTQWGQRVSDASLVFDLIFVFRIFQESNFLLAFILIFHWFKFSFDPNPARGVNTRVPFTQLILFWALSGLALPWCLVTRPRTLTVILTWS